MADNEIAIKFSADVSALRSATQEATDRLKNVGSSAQNAAQTTSNSFNQLNTIFDSAKTGVQGYSQNLAQSKSNSLEVASAIQAITVSSVELNQNLERLQQANTAAQVTEAERYGALMSQTDFRRALIREEAQDYQLGYQEELSALQRVNADKLAAIKAHYEALKALQNQGSVEYNRLSDTQVRVERQANLEHLRDVQDINRQLVRDYRSSFVMIGDNATKSLMGMLEGQRTLKESVRGMLLQIIEMFVQARVRTVAEWLAGTMAQAQASVVSESVKTSAVSAGTSARSALESSASSVSMAGTFTNVLKSILASASQTFAGIFGFLSPVLGPAAIGPAAAGEATVLAAASALPSFAVGAWSLPNDMVAQVHQGEMIIPAGPAAMMRSALSSSDRGPVTVQHSTNFNVSALDSQSVSQFFRQNGKHIMRSINDSVRVGAHLGFSKLSNL
ncbi:hypothetical protein [Beijerinckia mobilis]|uniref:hypothetical protein n=1 Tax=Beijerinckia mobilis TaxID=231434 RepID=UPI0005567AAA|nr:hypothetical protein [Beijerinckia mobilis]